MIQLLYVPGFAAVKLARGFQSQQGILFPILCIEKIMIEYIDVDTIIRDFACRNARRNYFV